MDHSLHQPFWRVAPSAQARTGPARRPRRAPVFIHDAVTPWRGETMLLSMLRAQAQEQAEDQDEDRDSTKA